MKTELVYNWMSREPITITPDAGLIEANNLLHEYSIRRLPVADNSRNLIGIVTLGDIREASPSDEDTLNVWELTYLLSKLSVREIMTPDPITVYSTDTMGQAAGLMMENKVSGLPVVDPTDESLVGIITESDIFRFVVQQWEEDETEETEIEDFEDVEI